MEGMTPVRGVRKWISAVVPLGPSPRQVPASQENSSSVAAPGPQPEAQEAS